MSQIEDELEELGYQIFAITPSLPMRNRKLVDESGYRYTLLSDPELSLTQSFGLVWHMSDEQTAQYKQYGIDLEKESGQKHHNLPVPAAYLVNTEGVVEFAYVNPEYKTRISSDVLLAAARAAVD